MDKRIIYRQHAVISLISFIILFIILFFVIAVIPDILGNPEIYFSTQLKAEELMVVVIEILLIISGTFLSYIVYLLLSSNTRVKISAYNQNKELSSYLEQFIRLYEEAPVPYLLLDEGGNIGKPNKATLRFFEVTPDEIEGKNLFGFLVDLNSEKGEKLVRYFKSKIPIDRQEVRFNTKNGIPKWVLFSVFHTGSKNFSGLATLFDISKQKELDKAKTEFLSLASHQLKTPVATIKWYLDMLLSDGVGSINQKQKEYLLRMQNVNENMIDLIGALLNVSRIEIGSIKPDIKKTNIIEIADSILSEVEYMINEKNIKLTKRYEGNLESIETDPKFLRIIIHNLISNAVKYTKDGGEVRITAKEAFGKTTIIISDNGIGIPAKEQSKIFTKMFRAENVNSVATNQGTGLGLFLVKSLLDMLEAKISFVSEENIGTTFTIKL